MLFLLFCEIQHCIQTKKSYLICVYFSKAQVPLTSLKTYQISSTKFDSIAIDIHCADPIRSQNFKKPTLIGSEIDAFMHRTDRQTIMVKSTQFVVSQVIYPRVAFLIKSFGFSVVLSFVNIFIFVP